MTAAHLATLVEELTIAVIRISSYAWKAIAALRVISPQRQPAIPANRTRLALIGLRMRGAHRLATPMINPPKQVVVSSKLPQYLPKLLRLMLTYRRRTVPDPIELNALNIDVNANAPT